MPLRRCCCSRPSDCASAPARTSSRRRRCWRSRHRRGAGRRVCAGGGHRVARAEGAPVRLVPSSYRHEDECIFTSKIPTCVSSTVVHRPALCAQPPSPATTVRCHRAQAECSSTSCRARTSSLRAACTGSPAGRRRLLAAAAGAAGEPRARCSRSSRRARRKHPRSARVPWSAGCPPTSAARGA